jgi:hypothetical protein
MNHFEHFMYNFIDLTKNAFADKAIYII